MSVLDPPDKTTLLGSSVDLGTVNSALTTPVKSVVDEDQVDVVGGS